MPYVQESRNRPMEPYPYHVWSPSGADWQADGPIKPVLMEEVYTYRSSGTNALGQSLQYDDLPGDVLRAEAMMQSKEYTTGDSGHIFWHTSRTSYPLILSGQMVAYSAGPNPMRYEGYMLPTRNINDSGIRYLLQPPSSNLLNSLGSKAVGRFQPEQPPLSLLVTLAELYREGLPALVGANQAYTGIWKNHAGDSAGVDFSAAVGSEYLNYQFGYVPLANDVATLASTLLRAHTIWEAWERNSKAQVRRKGIVDETVTAEYGELSSRQPSCGRYRPGGSGAVDGTTVFLQPAAKPALWREEIHTKVWFSGCFTFYLTAVERLFNRSWVGKAENLLGLQLTPEVLYNLTPWSWLFDWFGNLGQVLKVISNQLQYSQVMRYGYLMRQQTLTRTVTSDPVLDQSGHPVGPFVTQSVMIRKDRVRANPYGFGVDLSALSNAQWAILGALGLTRAPKSLLSP